MNVFAQLVFLVAMVAIGTIIGQYIKDYIDVGIMNYRFRKIDRENKDELAKRRRRRQA